MSSKTVSEKDLAGCMTWIQNMRRWAFKNNVDPWAVRQSLVWALAMDTAAAKARGIKLEDLESFDRTALEDIARWMKEH